MNPVVAFDIGKVLLDFDYGILCLLYTSDAADE